METKRIVIKDLPITYVASQPPRQPLNQIIFLHGWRSQARVWEQAMRFLSEWGYVCYALDLPGFGQTPAPATAWSVDDYAQCVAEFMQKIGVQQATVVGHSFGGRIALTLAATQPTLVQKLVLIDSAGIELPLPFKRRALAIVAHVVRPLFKPAFMQAARRRLYRRIGAEDYVATPALTQTLKKVISQNLTPLLPAIKQSTLIVWGDQDHDTPLAAAQILKEKINRSELVILKGAGHYSFIDEAEEFNKSLITFLKR